jgi:TrmH family RNA methyltransferase
MTRIGYSGKVMNSMRYTRITSASNRHIRDAIQIREKRTTFKHTAFLIEGPHLAEMAVNGGARISTVFVTETFMNKKEHQGLLRRMAGAAGEILVVTEQVLGKISDTETPQGITAVVSYQPLKPTELALQHTALIVVIDSIQDPGNLGTIIRTADAAGADAVVLLPGTCDAFMPKVIRSTSGSIFNVPVVYAEPDALVEWLREKKIHFAVTEGKAGKDIFSADLSGPLAIAFGNEAHGVSSKLKHAADSALSIPIFGKAESLNVAASAAICLYEILRQRRG